MGRATGGDDGIARQGNLARLEPLLQLGLGVLGSSLHVGPDLELAKQPPDQPLGCGIAAIQIHRPDEGLERVSQDRGSTGAPGSQFTLTQANAGRKAHVQRQIVQGVLLDQIGTHP